MTDTPPANPEFNAAGGSLPRGGGTAAAIIDVQLGCVKYMGREDARNYLSHLGNTIQNLRSQGIPINWAVINDENTLYMPQRGAGSDEPYPREDLEDMGFFRFDPRNDGDTTEGNQDIFEEFIAAHGPRKNEGVLVKTGFSIFESEIFTPYLQARGTKNLMTMGLVGPQCVLESSVDGVVNGFDTSMLLDGVASWLGQRLAPHENVPLVWREGFTSSEEAERWHRAEMDQALQSPTREFTAADRTAASQINYTTYAALTSSARALSPPPPPPAP